MAQYTNLNAPPERSLREIIDEKIQTRGSATGAAGVKDLGEAGDVVWPRPDGTAVSVRDVDLELADARQRIEDAEGDLAGAQARIDTALDAEGHVREDEILRNATLLGETVVEQINVTEKLVGVDGVFTGTVDFENINVTDEVLAARISGEYIYGTVLEGGTVRATGGPGGDEITLGEGQFLPSDGTAARPGLRVTEGGVAYIRPPGVGVSAYGGVEVSGGEVSGGKSYLAVSPYDIRASTTPGPDNPSWWKGDLDVGRLGVRLGSSASSTQSVRIRAEAPLVSGGTTLAPAQVNLTATDGGVTSRVHVRAGQAWLATGDRTLQVDSAGVWAKQGSDQVSLIPQVRQFQYSALWNADQSPAHIMVQHLPGGKLCQAQIRIQNLSGTSLSLPNETWVTLNYNPIPADLRGGFTDYIEVTLPQLSARGRVEMNYSTGSIRIRNISGTDIAWTNNNSIWFPMRWFSPD